MTKTPSPSEVIALTKTQPPVQHTVVIGAGPSGVRAAQELSKRGLDVTLFNAEKWEPYNRVQLSSLLADDVQIGQVFLQTTFPGPGTVELKNGVKVTDVDLEQQIVHGSDGSDVRYDRLIFATGSRAHRPPIPGIELDDVYVLRDMDDAQALLQKSTEIKTAVVIGGGLLGLEGARGLINRGVDVTVVEHEFRLMPRQLNDEAADLLKQKVEALGVAVQTRKRVDEIAALATGLQVTIRDNTTIETTHLEADIVVVCTGVRANMDLPRDLGLSFGRGISVDDQLTTSDPNVHAVGECAQHNDIVHGLVGPAFEQAAVVAKVIAGEDARYEGSRPCTKLKVLGAEVFSMGDFETLESLRGIRQHVYEDQAAGIYRCLYTESGKLRAALGVGAWPEASRVQEVVREQSSLNFLQTMQFRRQGEIWGNVDDDIFLLPDSAIICNCTGTTKGAILNAVADGAGKLEEVRGVTGANTVCGTCAYRVTELLGPGNHAVEPAKWWQYLVGGSAVAGALALATLVLPGIALSQSFNNDDLLRSLWFENEFKIISGFTLLGLSVAAAIIGLRKRIPALADLGSFDLWRSIHLGIGMLCGVGVFVHTGFRLGVNLNLLLMLSFLITLIFGAVAGFATGGEHELRDRGLIRRDNKPRTWANWVHILALWPLPVLLIIHILTVYSY